MDNSYKTNIGSNIEDYEDLAVKKSQAAKRAAIGGAVLVGGAAVAGGVAYANSKPGDDVDETLTADNVTSGAEVDDGIEPVAETSHTSEQTVKYVYVEKEVEEQPQQSEDDNVTWDETENYYVGDEKVMSIEKGTVDGHNFSLVDLDGDDKADFLGVDFNDDGKFEANEIMQYTPSDNVRMGHETSHVTDKMYFTEAQTGVDQGETVINSEGEPIHNNFEDEKTGEAYHDDYAEDNDDYNPTADVDYGNSGEYYPEEPENNYYASLDNTYESQGNEEAVTSDDISGYEDSGDSSCDNMMMSGEEFLG